MSKPRSHAIFNVLSISSKCNDNWRDECIDFVIIDCNGPSTVLTKTGAKNTFPDFPGIEPTVKVQLTELTVDIRSQNLS